MIGWLVNTVRVGKDETKQAVKRPDILLYIDIKEVATREILRQAPKTKLKSLE